MVFTSLTPQMADWSGPAHVHDGDGPVMDGTELRIQSIDAPELTQLCTLDGKPWFAGCAAREALSSFLAGKTVACADTGKRTFGRPVARCTVEGQSLEDIIVRLGWAFDWPKYSQGLYAAAEAEARTAGRGIWRGGCDKPWKWRLKQPKGWWWKNRCPGDMAPSIKP